MFCPLVSKISNYITNLVEIINFLKIKWFLLFLFFGQEYLYFGSSLYNKLPLDFSVVKKGSWGKHSYLLFGRHCLNVYSTKLVLLVFPAMCYAFSLSDRNDFPNEKIPTLREGVVESLNQNLTIYFDVKGHANQVKFIP